MKKFFLITLLTPFIFINSYGKIWRVNNNSGTTADFTSAQDAHNSTNVLAGDTINLEPSPASYGNLTCSKRLTWISTGAFLLNHPNEQFSVNPGKLDDLNVSNAGSNNSRFYGIYINNVIQIGSSAVRLDRCFFAKEITLASFAGFNPANVLIINCYSKNRLNIQQGNPTITNCIFEGDLVVGGAAVDVVVTNNVFNAVSSTVNTINNSNVENNIFVKANTAYAFNNSTVHYNMSGFPNVLPTGNNNQNNIDMNTVFVNSNGNTDSSFVLKTGSPAIGAGSGNPAVDLGAFGGNYPFKLALQPGIPAIYKIQGTVVPGSNTLNVIFSTKSNN